MLYPNIWFSLGCLSLEVLPNLATRHSYYQCPTVTVGRVALSIHPVLISNMCVCHLFAISSFPSSISSEQQMVTQTCDFLLLACPTFPYDDQMSLLGFSSHSLDIFFHVYTLGKEVKATKLGGNCPYDRDGGKTLLFKNTLKIFTYITWGVTMITKVVFQRRALSIALKMC